MQRRGRMRNCLFVVSSRMVLQAPRESMLNRATLGRNCHDYAITLESQVE